MTKRKILVIVPVPVGGEQLALRRGQVDTVPTAPDTEFHFVAVRASPTNVVSHHDYVLGDITILEAGLEAQKDGYDAVCVDTVSDSGVNALRSVLDIPVFGPGRTAYLAALMLGNRFSIVTMWQAWGGFYRKSLVELGLAAHCASIRAIDVQPDSRNLLSGKEDIVLPALLNAARACIAEDGAEVICLGSTTMHQAHAYLCQHLTVPVINPGPLSYKMIEAALDLGLTHSRAAYPRQLTPKREMIHAMLDGAVHAPAT